MPAKAAPVLPRVEPIVPTARAHPFNGPAWLFEPKYDGFRGVLYMTRQSCTLYSKRGNRMTRFQALADQVRVELGRREVILDGEIVALDEEGRISFWELMRGRGTLAYSAFDVLWLNGRDLRQLPLTQRKKRLERLIPAAVGTLNRMPCFEGEGLGLFQAACGLDLEGIVAKRKADPYSPTTPWYKIKNPTYTQAEGRGEFFERRA
jgi:bifunctional non-homologous end joining protein LigD